MRTAFRSLPVMTTLLVCLLFDISMPFDGAFHLEPTGHWVQVSTWASSTQKAPVVVRERLRELVSRALHATLPDGPVSARTPAARPPPAV